MYDCGPMTNERVVVRSKSSWVNIALAALALTVTMASRPARAASAEDDGGASNPALGGHKVINATNLDGYDDAQNILKFTVDVNKLIISGLKVGSSSWIVAYKGVRHE